jgi:putative spermidine/putrescine transport system permease protein
MLPLLLYFIIFVLAPQLVLFAVSLRGLGDDVTLQYFASALGDPLTFKVLLATLRIGLYTMLSTIVLGFPYAILMVRSGPKLKATLLLLAAMPLLISAVVRTFGWIVLLGNRGPINQLFMAFGWIERPITMLFTEGAVVVGLTQLELPLMVLTLFSVLLRQDSALELASRSLGAGYWRTFRKITLPLSVPGLLSGSALVFASSAGAFVSQTILGGGELMYMPMYIYQKSVLSQEWAYAAVLALVLMVTVGFIIFIGIWMARRSKGYLHD